MKKLQCTVCGGSMVMDIDGEFATCEYCGMKFDRRTVKQIVEGIHGYADLVKNAETFLGISDYSKARKVFEDITDKYPDKARGWWGLAESETENFQRFDLLGSVQIHYDRALKFASDDERALITSIFNEYYNRQKILDSQREEARQARQRISTKINELDKSASELNTKLNGLSSDGKLLGCVELNNIVHNSDVN